MIETIKCKTYAEMSELIDKLEAQGLKPNPGGIGYWWDAENCTVFVCREEEVEEDE